jgi:hypothetical protein
MTRYVPDAFLVAGVALVAVGLWLLHPAASLIFCGLFIAVQAVLVSARKPK